MACDRFTSTTSPAENGRAGVRVTVWSESENVSAPFFVPLARPNTRRLEAVTDDVSSGWSKVIETAVVTGATLSRTGEVETTCGSAACAATAAAKISTAEKRSVMDASVARAHRSAQTNSPVN